jgi:cob(I)alamin adenosyltransferase
MSGKIHLYYGDGKGKTTAAIGLCIRAAGHGKRVWFVQFLKGQPTGELEVLTKLPTVMIKRGECTKFSFQMTEDEKNEVRQCHNQMLQEAADAVKNGKCDFLILDEVAAAVQTGLLDERRLQELLSQKPEELELVLTGRNPAPYMIEAADYCTEMVKRKHPFDQGIAAREGIEY